MNFFEKLFLGIVVSIFSYFVAYPHLEPHIETLQDKLDSWKETREENELKKLDQELKYLEEQEPLINARLATQEHQERVNEKKRRLKASRRSLISKLREEWEKE